MRTTLRSLFVGLALLASIHSALAQNPVITSFSQNGVLICSNLNPGSVAAVQWASSPMGPWQTNWDSLVAITVGTNKSIQVSVPMFYRVVGVSATNQPPPGMGLIPAGAFTMGNSIGDIDITDAATVTVTVSAFYMDLNLVTSNQWRSVFAYATNHGYTLYRGLGKAADHPVQSVDWFDCVKWCNARSQQAGLAPVYYTDASLTRVFTNGDFGTTVYPNWAAKGYRLPTEAEWEKAARGGLSGQRFPWGPTNLISQSLANIFQPLLLTTSIWGRRATTQVTRTARLPTPVRWDHLPPMAMACSTWRGMSMSGVGTGMPGRRIRPAALIWEAPIHVDRHPEPSE